MAIYLDSAVVAEAEAASKLGWIKGITTNPALLAKSDLSPEDTLRALSDIVSGEICYQLTSPDFEDMVTEAHKVREIVGTQIVLKIPAIELGFRVAAFLSKEIPCAITGIYTPAQVAVAVETGVKYVIPYVNRATRFLGDGLAVVRNMSSVVGETEIMAASIKSPEEAVATLQAGAHHLTLPLNVLTAMTANEFSQQAVDEFALNGCGIS
ncbi:MAG: transaldolase family protein [Phormidesmis sp.]